MASGSGWVSVNEINPREYKCGYCEKIVGAHKGYFMERPAWRIYICPFCQKPTFFAEVNQNPSPILGNQVDGLPTEIGSLFNEARRSTSVGAFTASVLVCRKLLMNIAVSKGAKEGGSFISYVEYLSGKGYVPPDGKEWVEHIRKKGNEANHQIVLMSQEDANDLITFIEMLMKFIFEFPAKMKSTQVAQI